MEQGDLLPECPVLMPPDNLTDQLIGLKEGDEIDLPIPIKFGNLIIMSQSCDLAHDKIDQVLLCGYFPASDLKTDQRKAVQKERRPPLHMIEKCEIEEFEFKKQVVDFRTVYTLPKDFVKAFADTLEKRVRLLPPYKEHLSQAFARYFMRVGLPRPLEDD